jgi:hypothetical protein
VQREVTARRQQSGRKGTPRLPEQQIRKITIGAGEILQAGEDQ